MGLLEEFSIITKRHDDSMFEIFKKIIDDAKVEAETNKLDFIETFIHVSEKLQHTCAQLAVAKGVITDEENYVPSFSKYIMSEKLLDRIYDYIDPIIENARNDIRVKAESVLESASLEELQQRYDSLSSLLSNKVIRENSYLYEDIEFVKKNTK